MFRNFPTAPMILANAFENQIEIFKATGNAPKSVGVHARQRHLRFGDAEGHFGGVMPKFADMPYKILETIAYDPAARDLSVEVAKAKATNAEALLMVSRLNDAILITRELVKQRWSPKAMLSMGPGWYEDQYLKTLGKLGDGPMSFVPWYDPNKKLAKMLEAALAKAHPGRKPEHQSCLHLRGAPDCGRRLQACRLDRSEGARRRDPHDQHQGQCVDRSGHPVRRQGSEPALKNSAIQNRGGKLVTIAPQAASNAAPEHPMKPYDKR